MIIIDKLVVNTTYYDLLKSFRSYLNSKGIDYFRIIKMGQDNIQVSCPFHKDGKEKNASSGISLKDGTFHCFTCGKVKSFIQVLSYCLGYNDNGEAGKQWIIENSESHNVETRYLDSSLNRKVKENDFVSEEELDSYRYYHPYMFERKLTKEIINKFDVGFDKKDNSITFPVRDRSGNCLFIARRKVDYKYFNYPSKVEKPLYGVYELPTNIKSLIICESIFNCLTCYVYGKPSIALNGTGSKYQIEEIGKLPVRILYLGLDNDEAGDKGCIKIYKALKNKFIFYRFICPEGKDINDLTEEEFNNCYQNAKKIL